MTSGGIVKKRYDPPLALALRFPYNLLTFLDCDNMKLFAPDVVRLRLDNPHHVEVINQIEARLEDCVTGGRELRIFEVLDYLKHKAPIFRDFRVDNYKGLFSAIVDFIYESQADQPGVLVPRGQAFFDKAAEYHMQDEIFYKTFYYCVEHNVSSDRTLLLGRLLLKYGCLAHFEGDPFYELCRELRPAYKSLSPEPFRAILQLIEEVRHRGNKRLEQFHGILEEVFHKDDLEFAVLFMPTLLDNPVEGSFRLHAVSEYLKKHRLSIYFKYTTAPYVVPRVVEFMLKHCNVKPKHLQAHSEICSQRFVCKFEKLMMNAKARPHFLRYVSVITKYEIVSRHRVEATAREYRRTFMKECPEAYRLSLKLAPVDDIESRRFLLDIMREPSTFFVETGIRPEYLEYHIKRMCQYVNETYKIFTAGTVDRDTVSELSDEMRASIAIYKYSGSFYPFMTWQVCIAQIISYMNYFVEWIEHTADFEHIQMLARECRALPVHIWYAVAGHLGFDYDGYVFAKNTLAALPDTPWNTKNNVRRVLAQITEITEC